MILMSPEERIELWRLAQDSEGVRRRALLHAFSREVVEAMSAIDLYGEYEAFIFETIDLLDDGGLIARDSVRRVFEELHERDDGAEALAVHFAALLREAAGVEHLGVDRRIRAVDLSRQWREHLLTRSTAGRDSDDYLTVADVAARYGVTTQAVYKWLEKGRIEGEKRPGGSWRIPAGQFAEPSGFDRNHAVDLQKRLLQMHGDEPVISDEELGSAVRGRPRA